MREEPPTTAHLWAQRVLLSSGSKEGREPVALAEATLHAEARLQRRLVELVGVRGYAALLARAVRLAQAEVPALASVTVRAGAQEPLHGVRAFAESAAARGAPRVAEAGLIALLAQIIALLITLIGEDLVFRLVHEVWPELTPVVIVKEGHL